jgi:hypothetical protein
MDDGNFDGGATRTYVLYRLIRPTHFFQMSSSASDRLPTWHRISQTGKPLVLVALFHKAETGEIGLSFKIWAR